MEKIENIELQFLSLQDYEELKIAMQEAYTSMPYAYWGEGHIRNLISIFPEGQVVVKVNGEIAGCALSLIVDSEKLEGGHSYREVTGNYTFNTHSDEGDTLYGIDVFIKPEYRGLRLGRRLYDYRKELCEQKNLKGIAFGGRIPNYHKYADKMSPKEYIQKVRDREIHDPVLNFQLSNDFHPTRVLKSYLEGDAASREYAVLLEWDNIYYEKPRSQPQSVKRVVRLGLIQWQMRLYKGVEDVMQQAEYFIDAVSGYRSDFALFPEFFNAPLMADYKHLNESESIRKLAEYTESMVEKFSELSVSYNINIITGSDGPEHRVPHVWGRESCDVGERRP